MKEKTQTQGQVVLVAPLDDWELGPDGRRIRHELRALHDVPTGEQTVLDFPLEAQGQRGVGGPPDCSIGLVIAIETCTTATLYSTTTMQSSLTSLG